MVKKINVLVVGGTGFIGKNFLINFKKKNWKLWSISKKIPNKDEKVPNVIYKKCDILNFKNICKLNLKFYNYVIYAIGPEKLGDLKKKKDFELHKRHFLALKHFISRLDLKNLKKFIFFGSSEEYGFLKSPHKENWKTNKLKTPYALFKQKSTNYLKNLHKEVNFPAVILRVYLVYGPFQRENRLLPKYIKAFYKKKQIKITRGNQKKNFMYISDLISLIKMCFKVKKINGEIINVGSIKQILLKNIFKILDSKFKIKPSIKKKKMRLSELKDNYPSILKAKTLLNWESKVSLETGLKYTIKHYKQIY